MKNKDAMKWGSQGGRAILEKKGREYFVKLARKKWAKAKKKNV